MESLSSEGLGRRYAATKSMIIMTIMEMKNSKLNHTETSSSTLSRSEATDPD